MVSGYLMRLYHQDFLLFALIIMDTNDDNRPKTHLPA